MKDDLLSVARDMGYKPFNEIEVKEVLNLGGIPIYLDSKDKLWRLTDFYGLSEKIEIPNVVIDFKDSLDDSDALRAYRKWETINVFLYEKNMDCGGPLKLLDVSNVAKKVAKIVRYEEWLDCIEPIEEKKLWN